MVRELAADRLRLAMAMQREGTEMMRRNLRRAHPLVSEAEIATAEDWQMAEATVKLIKERGFHRGRALSTRLRRWRRALSG